MHDEEDFDIERIVSKKLNAIAQRETIIRNEAISFGLFFYRSENTRKIELKKNLQSELKTDPMVQSAIEIGIQKYVDTIKSQRNNLFRCVFCEKTFRSRFGLKLHVDSEHYANYEPIKCAQCTQKFANRSNMLRHVKIIHTKQQKLSFLNQCGLFDVSQLRKQQKRKEKEKKKEMEKCTGKSWKKFEKQHFYKFFRCIKCWEKFHDRKTINQHQANCI